MNLEHEKCKLLEQQTKKIEQKLANKYREHRF